MEGGQWATSIIICRALPRRAATLPPCCVCHKPPPINSSGSAKVRMHGSDGRQSMHSSLSHSGVHHFGSASETVPSCAHASLPNQCHHRVEEVRRKGRPGEKERGLAPIPGRGAIRRSLTQLMHFPAAEKPAKTTARSVLLEISAVMVCATLLRSLLVSACPLWGPWPNWDWEQDASSACGRHHADTIRAVSLQCQSRQKSRIRAQPGVVQWCRLAESGLQDSMAVFRWAGVSNGHFQIAQ